MILIRYWLMNMYIQVWCFYNVTRQLGEPLVAIMINQIACLARLREYAKHMIIEQSFRNDKSGGFDLKHTWLQHANCLNRLLLASAIAVFWCYEYGEFFLNHGDGLCRKIDPSYLCGISLFQFSFRYRKRSVATARLARMLVQAVENLFNLVMTILAIFVPPFRDLLIPYYERLPHHPHRHL